MEVRILRYYLKVFSIFLFLIILLFVTYIFFITNKKKLINKDVFEISKGENIEIVINNNFNKTNNLDLIIYKIYYRIYSLLSNNIIHYGDFNIDKNTSYYKFLKIVTQPSNVLNKITIIEGWSKKELNNELSKYFDDNYSIDYNDILSDTYYFGKHESFDSIIKKFKEFKKKYIISKKNNIFFDNFDQKDLLIIGSLIEKEGLDTLDKRNISSVIMNRLNKGMKLQIDATVIYAITDGNYNLNRNLTYKDLKIEHPYNTYFIDGLPPNPISYVGTKTIDIILENYKSEYLFYFYNNILKKHVFSKNYNEHRKKLNEYRNKK